MATYAMGDLHGHLEVLKKIQAFLKPGDTVYFLGDACDRGPQSYECIKAIAEDSRFVYIKGNHEDMLVKAIKDYLDDDFMWDYQSYSLFSERRTCYNGSLGMGPRPHEVV